MLTGREKKKKDYIPPAFSTRFKRFIFLSTTSNPYCFSSEENKYCSSTQQHSVQIMGLNNKDSHTDFKSVSAWALREGCWMDQLGLNEKVVLRKFMSGFDKQIQSDGGKAIISRQLLLGLLDVSAASNRMDNCSPSKPSLLLCETLPLWCVMQLLQTSTRLK